VLLRTAAKEPWQTTAERAKRGSKDVGGTGQQARAFS